MKAKNIVVGLAGLLFLVLQGCGSSTGSGAAATNSITMQGSLSLTGATTSGILGSGALALGQSVSDREGDDMYCITFEENPQAFKELIKNGEFEGDYEGGAGKSFGCFLVTPEATLPIIIDLSGVEVAALAAAAGSVMAWTMTLDEKTSVVTAEVKITSGKALDKGEIVDGEGIDLTGLNHQIYRAEETEQDFYGLTKSTTTKKSQRGPGPGYGPPQGDEGIPSWITLHYDAGNKQLLLGEQPTRSARDANGNWIFQVCKNNDAGKAVCEVLDVGTDKDTAKQRFEKYYASWKRVLANIIPSSVVTKWKDDAANRIKGRFNWCRTRANKEYKIGYIDDEKRQAKVNELIASGIPWEQANFEVFNQFDLSDITEVTSITLAQKADWFGANKGEAVVAIENEEFGHTQYLMVQAWSLSTETGEVFPEPIVVDISGATEVDTDMAFPMIVGLEQTGPAPVEPAVPAPPPMPGYYRPQVFELAQAISASKALAQVKSGEAMGNKECDADFQAREEFLEVLRDAGPSIRRAAMRDQQPIVAPHHVAGDVSLTANEWCEQIGRVTPQDLQYAREQLKQMREGRDKHFEEKGQGPIAYDSKYTPPVAGPMDNQYFNFKDEHQQGPTEWKAPTNTAPGYQPGGYHPEGDQYQPYPSPSPYPSYEPPHTVIALGQFAPPPGQSPIPGPAAPAPGPVAAPGPVMGPPIQFDPLLEETALSDGNKELSDEEGKKYFKIQRGMPPECLLTDAEIAQLAAIATHALTSLPRDDLRPEYVCEAEIAETAEVVAAAVRGLEQSATGAGMGTGPVHMLCQHELVGNAWPSDVFAVLDVTSAGNVVKGSSVIKRDHRFKVGEEYQGCYEVEGVDANLKQIGEGGIDADHKLTATHQWLAAFTIYHKNTCKFVTQKGGKAGQGEKDQFTQEDESEATEKFQAELTPVNKGDADYPPDDWFKQLSQ